MEPDRLEVMMPMVFILSVEYVGESRYGDSSVLLAGTAERLGVVLVFPAFEHTPWYADTPDGLVRQESALLGANPAVVEERLGRSVPPARRMLGFTQSGWGAFSLLLRQPAVFGCAAAWDALFYSARLGRWDLDSIIGSRERLAQHSLQTLAPQQAAFFGAGCRLVLHGYNLFKYAMQKVHQILINSGIFHHFRNDTASPHTWNLAWLEPLLADLLEIYRGKTV